MSGSEVETGFVNPDYFRMLHHSSSVSPSTTRPTSPEPGLAHAARSDAAPLIHSSDQTASSPRRITSPTTEFVGSSPASPPSPTGISSAAFTPNYFKRFFVEEGELGRGGKGVVLLVKHVLDGVSLGHFACKRVPVGDDHEWLKKVLVEVQLLQRLSHQNLVSYRHVWLEDYQLTKFGPSVPCAFILQQYCNAGDLHRYVCPPRASTTVEQLKDQVRRHSKGQLEPPRDLHMSRRLSFDEIYSFFTDITSGLNHLHTNGFIHRDLKPSNCLLHDNGKGIRVLVSDFGEAQMETMARRSTGATGTVSYCAPEVLQPEYPGGMSLGQFTTKSDIFSLGMILYFMCFSRLPYRNADNVNEENEDVELLRAEITRWVGFEDEARARPDLPDKLYKFLKRLLSLDPAERPTAEEILWGISAGNGTADSPAHHGAGVKTALPPTTAKATTAAWRRPGSSSGKRPSYGWLRRRSPSPPDEDEDEDGGEELLRSESAVSNGSSIVLRKRLPASVPSAPSSPYEARAVPQLLPPEGHSPHHPHHHPHHPHHHHHDDHHPPPWAPTQVAGFSSTTAALVKAVKLALFVAKLVSVTRLCSPLAASAWTLYPLLVLAAADFLVAGNNARGVSAALIVVHVVVLALSSRAKRACVVAHDGFF